MYQRYTINLQNITKLAFCIIETWEFLCKKFENGIHSQSMCASRVVSLIFVIALTAEFNYM